jgi:hypothetical protein
MKAHRDQWGSYRLEGEHRFHGFDGGETFTYLVPGNDLLGLRDEPSYLDWIERRWTGVIAKRRSLRWLRDGTVDALIAAARLAAEGQGVYSLLAPWLDRIRFHAGGTLEVPDFPALAAWSIERCVSAGLRLVECPECERPRYASRSAGSYCYRPAPDRTMTCAQLHAHERFAEKRRDWNAEYRRIYARKLRGTVSDEEWQAWRSDEMGSALAPEQFIPFDLWRNPEIQKRNEEIRALLTRPKASQPSFIEELQKLLRGPPATPSEKK